MRSVSVSARLPVSASTSIGSADSAPMITGQSDSMMRLLRVAKTITFATSMGHSAGTHDVSLTSESHRASVRSLRSSAKTYAIVIEQSSTNGISTGGRPE